MSISPEEYTPFDDHSEWFFESQDEESTAPLVSMTLNQLVDKLLQAAKDKQDFEKRMPFIHPAVLRGEIGGAGARLNSFKTSLSRARGFSELTLHCYEKHEKPLTVKNIRGFIGALCRQHEFGLEKVLAMPLDEAARLLTSDLQSKPQSPSAATVGERESEGEKPPPDLYAELRQHARRLSLQERKLIEALCNARGELPLVDVKTLCDWCDPIESAWNSLRMRLNKKLKSHGWRVSTKARTARLTNFDPT